MVLSPKHAAEQSPGMMAHAHHDSDAAEDITARDHLAAQDALREALAATAADLAVEPDVLFQDAAHGLVAASERLDLLVMGSAAHGPAGELALGGMTRDVTASARLPGPRAAARWRGADRARSSPPPAGTTEM